MTSLGFSFLNCKVGLGRLREILCRKVPGTCDSCTVVRLIYTKKTIAPPAAFSWDECGLRLLRFGCELLCDPGEINITGFIHWRCGRMENLHPSASVFRSGAEEWKLNVH